jgi:hypothetical protein
LRPRKNQYIFYWRLSPFWGNLLTVMPDAKTKAAFDGFRANYLARAMPPNLVTNQDQLRQMTEADGLQLWQDGPVGPEEKVEPSDPPILTMEDDARKMLWAVRETDVPYAAETDPFGRGLESRVIKHSNLTGGKPAHCAGEIVIMDEKTIVVNGSSGRYGPKSLEELEAVAKAFRGSGYNVWCMGYDTEQARALPFVGSAPKWIA